MTKIESYPFVIGKSVMKSMEQYANGRVDLAPSVGTYAGGVCACAYSNPLHLHILSFDLFILSYLISSLCMFTYIRHTCLYKQSSSFFICHSHLHHSSRIHRFRGVSINFKLLTWSASVYVVFDECS